MSGIIEIKKRKIKLGSLDKTDFLYLYEDRYKKFEDAKLKMAEMIDYLGRQNYNYNWTNVYRDICEQFEFTPGMDKLKGVFHNNIIKVIEKKYPVVNNQIHEVNGEYMCIYCLGLGGERREDPHQDNYIAFFGCKHCLEEGLTWDVNKDIFKPYMMNAEQVQEWHNKVKLMREAMKEIE